jgi:thiol-disulfide isomerase/thioredoxin
MRIPNWWRLPRPSRGSTPKLLALVVMIGLIFGGLSACSAGKSPRYEYDGVTKLGRTIPETERKLPGNVSAPDLADAKTWTLASLKGQVVVLNMWAVWCTVCQVEAPNFDKIYRAYKPKGVTFVGIDTKDTNTRSDILDWLKLNKVSYPNVYDPLAKTSIELGRVPVLGLPATIVIDKEGRVAAVYDGNVAAGDLDPALNSLLAEK